MIPELHYTYTFTLYALSGAPTFTAPVTGKNLTDTISPLLIGGSQVNVTYTRSGL